MAGFLPSAAELAQGADEQDGGGIGEGRVAQLGRLELPQAIEEGFVVCFLEHLSLLYAAMTRGLCPFRTSFSTTPAQTIQ